MVILLSQNTNLRSSQKGLADAIMIRFRNFEKKGEVRILYSIIKLLEVEQ